MGITPKPYPSWESVAQKPEYLSLPDEEKSAAKEQYFNSVVAPNVPSQDMDAARLEFSNWTKKLEISEETPGWLSAQAKSWGWAGKRSLGFAFGAVNSPLAFLWGTQSAPYLDEEEYNKLPWWKQYAKIIGEGGSSAWRSISKEGDWGTMYGEYFKEVTSKTIEEKLPQKLKWASPSVEFLANVITDPLIGLGEAANIAKLRVPKHYVKNMPKRVVKELEKFEKLEKAEKQVLQTQLLKHLKNREDYMGWWKNQLDEIALAEERIGQPLLKPGTRVAPDLTAPRSSMAGQPKQIKKLVDEQQGLIPDVGEAATITIPKTKLHDLIKSRLRGEEKLKAVNDFRAEKGLPPVKKLYTRPTTLKATGGLVLGVGEDEDGNITYDLRKGLAGSLMLAGGMRVAGKGKKLFAETMTKNPAWAKVHGMVGKQKGSFTLSGLFGRLNTGLFDRFGKLKKAGLKAYEAARTYHAYKDVSKKKFDELKADLQPVRNDEVIFTDYVDAHRAMTRGARGLKNPNKVTYHDAVEAIKEIEAHYKLSGKDPQVLRDSIDAFQKWTHDYILKEALDSGFISQKGYDKILKNNEWYAAFEVLDKLPPSLHNIPSGVSGEYFSVANQNIIKSMTGTEKQIANPIESTVKKFAEAQATFARNKVASAFIDDPKASGLFRPVAATAKEFKILQQQGKNPVLQGAWKKTEFDTINRFKDGVVERYVVPKEIADAMKQLTPWQAPRVIQALNAVFRKAATTVYIPFTISNAMRDAFMAYTTAPVHKMPHKFAKDWGKGFWEGAKHEFLGSSKMAEEYISSGGGFGYVGNIRNTNLAKAELFKRGMVKTAKDVVASPFSLIEKVSATIELAPRLGTFDRAKMVGLASDDAALLAKQATIDFNRGGTWTKVANQFVPFLNARVQGRVTLAQAIKKNPKNTLSKVFVSTAVPGMAAYAWNRLYHSDLYDDIPAYIKDNYFTIITGTDTDERGKTVPKYLVISKGDVGQMAWNPIEYGMDRMWEKDPESTKKFLINYLSDLSPVEFAREGELSASKAAGSLLPPIVKGGLESWANLNFYRGTEIVPYYMGKTKPPELQYKENTPESYKWLGKKIGVSPLHLQNFASNVVAGYGREGLDPTAMMRGLTGRIIKTRGGEQERQAWTTIKDIEQGYVYTVAYAEELSRSGDNEAAQKLINEWNSGLGGQIDEFNKRFKKYGIVEKGGLRSSYMITPGKRKTIFMKKMRRQTYLERRLSKRKY
jgi:hypothetical protein